MSGAPKHLIVFVTWIYPFGVVGAVYTIVCKEIGDWMMYSMTKTEGKHKAGKKNVPGKSSGDTQRLLVLPLYSAELISFC